MKLEIEHEERKDRCLKRQGACHRGLAAADTGPTLQVAQHCCRMLCLVVLSSGRLGEGLGRCWLRIGEWRGVDAPEGGGGLRGHRSEGSGAWVDRLRSAVDAGRGVRLSGGLQV